MAMKIDGDEAYIPWDKLGDHWDDDFESTSICPADIALIFEIIFLLTVAYRLSFYFYPTRKSGYAQERTPPHTKYLLALFSFVSLAASTGALDYALATQATDYDSFTGIDYSNSLLEESYCYSLAAMVLLISLLGLYSASKEVYAHHLPAKTPELFKYHDVTNANKTLFTCSALLLIGSMFTFIISLGALSVEADEGFLGVEYPAEEGISYAGYSLLATTGLLVSTAGLFTAYRGAHGDQYNNVTVISGGNDSQVSAALDPA